MLLYHVLHAIHKQAILINILKVITQCYQNVFQ